MQFRVKFDNRASIIVTKVLTGVDHEFNIGPTFNI